MYKYNGAILRPYDIIVTRYFILDHYIIYLGGKDFIHCIPETGVTICNLHEVNKRGVVEVLRYSEIDTDVIAARIEECKGKAYDLFDFNCETFKNYVFTGNAQSKQINQFAAWFLNIKKSINEGIKNNWNQSNLLNRPTSD